jgi:hypothetical protein
MHLEPGRQSESPAHPWEGSPEAAAVGPTRPETGPWGCSPATLCPVRVPRTVATPPAALPAARPSQCLRSPSPTVEVRSAGAGTIILVTPPVARLLPALATGERGLTGSACSITLR